MKRQKISYRKPLTLQESFEDILKMYKLTQLFVREYRFHPKRRWRFDYAYLGIKLAVEIEGGAFIGGRHTRGVWFVKDCEKYNAAVVLGWKVLRYASKKQLATFPDDFRMIKENQ